MKKLLLVSLCMLVLCVTHVFAQSRTVTGVVTSKDDGESMPGVTVVIKGTTKGTQTDANGRYSISNVPTGAVLEFRYIGTTTVDLPVPPSGPLNVVLGSNARQLTEVVVTGALGIRRAASEVGYATTKITSGEANQSNVVDPLNGLTGKVAGLTIQQTSDGVNPTVRVTLRGNRSISGNNSALIVVDGQVVPAAILQNINPDDIQDYNVLNGSGAAALYGSQASNGAIVITTKRGTSNGKPQITYNNSFQLNQVAYYPKFQKGFGQYGGEGNPFINPVTGQPMDVPYENQQYGPAFNGSIVNVGVNADSSKGPQLTAVYSPQKKSPEQQFFQNGLTEQNYLSFRQGDAANNFGVSVRDVTQKGVVPYDQGHIDNVRVTGTRTNGIFKADFSVNYTKQTISTFGNGYDGSNLMTNLAQFPQFLNIQDFKNSTTGTFSDPSNYFSAYSINPWWIVQNSRQNISRDQFQGNLNLTLSPTKWVDITYRIDDNFGVYRLKTTQAAVNFSAYAKSLPQSALGGVNESYFYPNGVKGQTSDAIVYGDGSGTILNTTGNQPSYYGDPGLARLEGTFLLNFHHTFFNDFRTTLLLGNTIWNETGNYIYDATTSLGLANYYNVNAATGTPTLHQANESIRQVANFGDATITYKSYGTIEATLRNDNDSRLPLGHQSLWYPSVKLSVLPTEFIPSLKNNDILSYAKFFLDISRVGQITSGPYPGATYGNSYGFPFTSSSALSLTTNLYPGNLVPQINSETEVGADLGFFKDRLHIGATYYNQVARNQTLPITTSPTTGYTLIDVNAGSIQSRGAEFVAQAVIVPAGAHNVGWTVGGNFSINTSKVLSLLPGINSLNLGNLPEFQQNVGGIFAVVGKPYPQLLVTDYRRDPQGHVIVNPSNGYPSTNPNLVDEGSTAPKYNLGLNTSVTYKFMTLSIQAEYRTGYLIYNELGAAEDFGGTSAVSAAAGRQIFIYPNSVLQTGPNTYVPNTTVPVQKGGTEFWSTYPVNVGSPYVYSGAFWSLREARLAFNLNKFFTNNKYIKGLTFALTGRNLLLFVPKSNQYGSPELSDAGATGNNIGSASSNQIPAQRIYGADLQITF